MRAKELNGNGRLIPARLTGVGYAVRYGIRVVESISPQDRFFGRLVRRRRWAKCSLHCSHTERLPDGAYFLHADDGRVHQVRHSGGEWHCLRG
jgi:hypothetical protein